MLFFNFLLIKKQFLTLIIGNVSCTPNQHIRIISEGSCDIEDWSNDAKNSALHHRNTLHFKCILKYKTVILNYNNISQHYSFYCNFKNITLNYF